jgi:hypothetical protein
MVHDILLCGEAEMPLHEWDRVRAGKFHHFHNSWIYKLCDRLNAGLLPRGFYAAGKQVAGDVEPDVLTLQRSGESQPDWRGATAVIAVEEHPPKATYTFDAEQGAYVRKQDQVVIRATDGDRIVALIEIVSRANKQSRHEIDRFLRKIAAAIDSGYHTLMIDLHIPGSFDPLGMHAAVWDYMFGTCPELPSGARSIVSYRVDPSLRAYVEPLALGQPLPSMPLFLDAAWYVRTPLEETYMQAWAGLPEPWKQEITGSRTSA